MRFMSRVLVVAAVVIALTMLSVPIAQALPLDGGREVLRVDVPWLQAALSWIAHLLPTGDHGTLQQVQTASGTGGDKSTIGPLTGSCIDPQGNPLPRCGGF